MPKILITTSSLNVSGTASPARLTQASIEIVTNPFGRKLTEDEVAVLLDGEVVGMVAGVERLMGDLRTGAAIDTFEIEPCAGPLAGLPQTVLTDQLGSYAAEAGGPISGG